MRTIVLAFAAMPALAQGDWVRALWGGALLAFRRRAGISSRGRCEVSHRANRIGGKMEINSYRNNFDICCMVKKM
jgi:hypothetical protein